MSGPRHPHQPLVTVDGVRRFKQNAIVRALVDAAREGRRLDLNDIGQMDFDAADRVQLVQLVGYSASGFAELSYVSDADYAVATAEPGESAAGAVAAANAATRERIAAELEHMAAELRGAE